MQVLIARMLVRPLHFAIGADMMRGSGEAVMVNVHVRALGLMLMRHSHQLVADVLGLGAEFALRFIRMRFLLALGRLCATFAHHLHRFIECHLFSPSPRTRVRSALRPSGAPAPMFSP